MSNGKSGRKKLVKTLTTIIAIIVLVIGSLYGINERGLIPDDETTATHPKETTLIQNVEGEFVVHMIDVGQADCFLIIQNGQTALVDCGTRSTGKDAVEYIKKLGITTLNYVIGTHPHDDHMGGMYDIITNFEVGTVIMPDSRDAEITANWYIKLMEELKTGDYNVEYPKQGDIYNLEDVVMKVLSAETDVSGNTNNYSIVMKVSFGEMDMIMTGDAETEIEEQILESGVDIDAEILKVGHHGSDTSTSQEFLDAITPDYGLISCKTGNKHEHPIKSTMEKLKECNVEVYRTDECGSVIMTITTDSITFNCNPGDYLSGTEWEERNAA